MSHGGRFDRFEIEFGVGTVHMNIGNVLSESLVIFSGRCVEDKEKNVESR